MADTIENICVKEKFFILVKNADTIFVFWNFSEFQRDGFEKGEYSPKVKITLFAVKEQEPLSVSEFNWKERKSYLKIPKRGKDYLAVLYAKTSAGEELRFFESNIVSTPLSQDGEILATYGSQFFKRGDL